MCKGTVFLNQGDLEWRKFAGISMLVHNTKGISAFLFTGYSEKVCLYQR
jgi:hypothetical protein